MDHRMTDEEMAAWEAKIQAQYEADMEEWGWMEEEPDRELTPEEIEEEERFLAGYPDRL